MRRHREQDFLLSMLLSLEFDLEGVFIGLVSGFELSMANETRQC